MARIENVDYLAIPQKAHEMEECGSLINNDITTVFQKVEEMHGVWYGTRYNELVQAFNLMTEDLNHMLTLIMNQIPNILRTAANNYSQLDCGKNVTNEQGVNPNAIQMIKEKNDVGIKFISLGVQEKEQEIIQIFERIVARMNEMENIYHKIDWVSEASDVFTKTFIPLKEKIVTEFEQTKATFRTLMDKALQDAQKVEDANTLK